MTTRPQMHDSVESSMQIDETRFVIRVKYNRNQILRGDRHDISDNNDAAVANNRIYSERISGPWIHLQKCFDYRYFMWNVEIILMPIIQQEFATGSIISSNERGTYAKLTRIGYHHLVFNNQENYRDSTTGHKCNILKDLGSMFGY